MKRRGSIPVPYWPALIDAAEEQGIQGIDHRSLTDLHSRKRLRPDETDVEGMADEMPDLSDPPFLPPVCVATE
ncbi:hypothetical protein [Microcystis phage Mwe-JY08]